MTLLALTSDAIAFERWMVTRSLLMKQATVMKTKGKREFTDARILPGVL